MTFDFAINRSNRPDRYDKLTRSGDTHHLIRLRPLKPYLMTTVALLAASLSQPILAQTEPQHRTNKTKPTYEYRRWGLGLLVQYESEIYLDAGSEADALPLIQLEWGRFEWDAEEISYTVIDTESFSLAPLISIEFDGYEIEDADIFTGMEDRQFAIHAGLAFEAEPTWSAIDWLEIEGNIRQDISGESDGFIADLSLGADAPLGRWFVGIAIGLEYLSEDYADYYYGVEPRFARYDRPTYLVDAALNPFVEFSLRYQLTESWVVGLEAEYLTFDSTITDSPLVDADDQIEIFAGAYYEFFN